MNDSYSFFKNRWCVFNRIMVTRVGNSHYSDLYCSCYEQLLYFMLLLLVLHMSSPLYRTMYKQAKYAVICQDKIPGGFLSWCPLRISCAEIWTLFFVCVFWRRCCSSFLLYRFWNFSCYDIHCCSIPGRLDFSFSLSVARCIESQDGNCEWMLILIFSYLII